MEEEIKSKVYVLLGAGGKIIRCDGGYTIKNIEDIENWTFVDEGYGDRYNLCQTHYLPDSAMDDRGICRYKLVDGQVVERTQAEMDADYIPSEPVEPEQPTGALQERVATLEAQLAEMEAAYIEGVNEV